MNFRRALHRLVPLLALLSSCEKGSEDYRYPSVVTDFACLITDANKQPERLRLDNGRSYPITFADEYKGTQTTYKPDTVYRIISIYELTSDSTACLYTMASATSVIPTPLRNGEKLYQDPAYLQSSWLSGGYLNMVIELKALNGRHAIGFVDTTPTGMHGKEFTFYHNANNDIESYRQKLYASLPLAPFEASLQPGDTLRFVINTYDKGMMEYEFEIE